MNLSNNKWSKNLKPADTSTFAQKTNLVSLKTKVFKLDIEKLAPDSVDLSKFSDVIKKLFMTN